MASWSIRWALFAGLSLSLSIALYSQSRSSQFAKSSTSDTRGVHSGQQDQIVLGYSESRSRFTWIDWTKMWLQTVIAASLAALSSAYISPMAANSTNTTTIYPTVKLSYGSYEGTNLQGGISQFLGMHYANFPQRFSASTSPTIFNGTQKAQSYGPGCKGSGSLGATDSEDCLLADVFVPTRAIGNTTAKLPVYAFIQGGGLTNTLGRFNGSGIIQASGLNIITVAFTYRTGPFGFLASKEVKAGGTLNAGLLDQYQLLKWIQKEISAFGGDPGRVTLGGQSAGGGCVVNHLTASKGTDKKLFHAALIESPSSPPIRRVSEQQFQYDNLVNNTNCAGPNSLTCLRSLTANQVLAGSPITPYPTKNVTGNPVFGWHIVIDGSYVTDLPVSSFKNGKYVHVPLMIGDVTDEGTVFTPPSISNITQSQAFIKNNFPNINSTQLNSVSTLYGFESNSTNYWLKPSTAYGEIRYVCPGISISNSIPTSWNFRYNVATASQISSLQGSSHGSDLAAVWAPYYGSSDEVALLKGNGRQTKNWLQGYWTSFIRAHDPNTFRYAGSPTWGTWDKGSRFLFNVTGSGIETVAALQKRRCLYLNTIAQSLEQ